MAESMRWILGVMLAGMASGGCLFTWRSIRLTRKERAERATAKLLERSRVLKGIYSGVLGLSSGPAVRLYVGDEGVVLDASNSLHLQWISYESMKSVYMRSPYSPKLTNEHAGSFVSNAMAKIWARRAVTMGFIVDDRPIEITIGRLSPDRSLQLSELLAALTAKPAVTLVHGN